VKEVSDGRADQIRTILESRTFRNTEVLKRLLDYLGRQAIEGPAEDLKEYTVGIQAFSKPADYDPQTDSSVRVQAGKLRQKLDEYYRMEGQQDGLLVELPKGHFRLEFRPRAAPAVEPARPPARQPGRPWRGIAAAAVVVLALLAGGWYIVRPRPVLAPGALAEPWNAEMEELWRPLLASRRPILVVIGTPLFEKVAGDFFRDPALNTWENAGQADSVRGVEKALGAPTAVPAFPYTGVGEAQGAFTLQRLLLPRGLDLTLQTSNQLSWEVISRYNVIFLGPPKYNLQTLDLPVQQDFEISHARVRNLHPRPGEPADFVEKFAQGQATLEEGHALVSRLPGLHRTGDLFMMAGSSTESTRAAVEFMTRPEYVTPFVRWMRSQPGGVPQWFQVVLRAHFKSGTPIAIERVAFHSLT
jgi:hypothetical protein